MTSGEQLASPQNQKGAVSIFPQAGQIMNNSINSQILTSSITFELQTLFSQTLPVMGGFLKNTEAFFRHFFG